MLKLVLQQPTSTRSNSKPDHSSQNDLSCMLYRHQIGTHVTGQRPAYIFYVYALLLCIPLCTRLLWHTAQWHTHALASCLYMWSNRSFARGFTVTIKSLRDAFLKGRRLAMEMDSIYCPAFMAVILFQHCNFRRLNLTGKHLPKR